MKARAPITQWLFVAIVCFICISSDFVSALPHHHSRSHLHRRGFRSLSRSHARTRSSLILRYDQPADWEERDYEVFLKLAHDGVTVENVPAGPLGDKTEIVTLRMTPITTPKGVSITATVPSNGKDDSKGPIPIFTMQLHEEEGTPKHIKGCDRPVALEEDESDPLIQLVKDTDYKRAKWCKLETFGDVEHNRVSPVRAETAVRLFTRLCEYAGYKHQYIEDFSDFLCTTHVSGQTDSKRTRYLTKIVDVIRNGYTYWQRFGFVPCGNQHHPLTQREYCEATKLVHSLRFNTFHDRSQKCVAGTRQLAEEERKNPDSAPFIGGLGELERDLPGGDDCGQNGELRNCFNRLYFAGHCKTLSDLYSRYFLPSRHSTPDVDEPCPLLRAFEYISRTNEFCRVPGERREKGEYCAVVDPLPPAPVLVKSRSDIENQMDNSYRPRDEYFPLLSSAQSTKVMDADPVPSTPSTASAVTVATAEGPVTAAAPAGSTCPNYLPIQDPCQHDFQCSTQKCGVEKNSNEKKCCLPGGVSTLKKQACCSLDFEEGGDLKVSQGGRGVCSSAKRADDDDDDDDEDDDTFQIGSDINSSKR